MEGIWGKNMKKEKNKKKRKEKWKQEKWKEKNNFFSLPMSGSPIWFLSVGEYK
jgi:hypothetical protein